MNKPRKSCLGLLPILGLLLFLSTERMSGYAQIYTEPTRTPATASPGFAFWYEDWEGTASFDKLARPHVLIGLAPSGVNSIHQNGSRALRYVTFYQSALEQTFLKDKLDLENVGFWNGRNFLLSVLGSGDRYVLCDNSKVMRERTFAFVDQSLRESHFDGLFIDNTYLNPAAKDYCKSKFHYHVQPGARGDDAWLELLAEVRRRIKETSPGDLIITNPGDPNWADRLGTGAFGSLWDLSDYVTWESYGYTSIRGQEHDRWQRTIESSFDLANARRSKILALSYPLDRREALYSFAVARIFGFEWTANLGEKDANTSRNGGHFGSFLSAMPFDLGSPAGPIDGGKESDHIRRRFSSGEAVANISDSTITVAVPSRVRLYLHDRVTDTTRPTKVALPPRTAAVYVFEWRHATIAPSSRASQQG